MSPSTSGLKRGLVAAAAVGALLLAGCSDDGDDTAKADTSSETTVAAKADTSSETTAAAKGDASSETTAKSSDATKTTPAPKRNPSVDGFCKALADVANQQAGDQDYAQLKATAPDDIAPMVDTLAKAADEAASTEQPSAELQERGIRSVVGVTIYAIDECPDASGLIEAIGIDENGVKVLKKYSVEDVEDDATWKKIFAEIQQG